MPDDNTSLMLCKAASDTVATDFEAGNQLAAHNDYQKAQGFMSQIMDPLMLSQASVYVQTAADYVAKLDSPDVAAANTTAWNQKSSDVQANASMLNNDEIYQSAAKRENADIKAAVDGGNYNAPRTSDGGWSFGAGTGASPDQIKKVGVGALFAAGGATMLIAAGLVIGGLIYLRMARVI